MANYFEENNVKVLGIEPTSSAAKIVKEKGIETIEEFFGVELANQLLKQNLKADLILGNNVLAHVPDINGFVAGIKISLKEDRIVTMELPHLLNLVNLNQFDIIYHEHFSYLSLHTVKQIFEKQGLILFHVEELPAHGGSLRIFGKHKNAAANPLKETINILLEKEIFAGINNLDFYKNFETRVLKVKLNFLEFLIQSKKQNQKVAAYGAAAKGNTMLNYCGVKSDLIKFVVDLTPSKQGKLLPGSHVHIVTEIRIKKLKPDFVIIFPWNIKDEVTNQLNYIKDWGGSLLRPFLN